MTISNSSTAQSQQPHHLKEGYQPLKTKHSLTKPPTNTPNQGSSGKKYPGKTNIL